VENNDYKEAFPIDEELRFTQWNRPNTVDEFNIRWEEWLKKERNRLERKGYEVEIMFRSTVLKTDSKVKYTELALFNVR
jgi:hypothetical protein